MRAERYLGYSVYFGISLVLILALMIPIGVHIPQKAIAAGSPVGTTTVDTGVDEFPYVPPLTTIEIPVTASSDDAEESDLLGMFLDSSDLELVYDSDDDVNQIVGIRFAGVNVPQNAGISNAYIQFQVDEASSEHTILTIAGQAVDNAPTFTSLESNNISSRIRTSASVSWYPIDWNTVGAVGQWQRTTDISAIVQEIVSRPGWASGNSLAIIISGSGKRVAEAYDGDPSGAPLLHVEYFAESREIYVNDDATGANNGSSWTDAFTDLQDALDVAIAGNQIWIAEGTYEPSVEYGGAGDRYKSFRMINGVGIYGGFDPSIGDDVFDERDWENNVTILSGDIGIPDDNSDNCYHVFSHDEGWGGGGAVILDESAILDGFTITGGNANGSDVHDGGGGMANGIVSSPTVRNCIFSKNAAIRDGGGMKNEAYDGGCSPKIINCTFSENRASRGGGMKNFDAQPTVIDCIFIGNIATDRGGGGN